MTEHKSKKNKNKEITEILWQIKARTTVKKNEKKNDEITKDSFEILPELLSYMFSCAAFIA